MKVKIFKVLKENRYSTGDEPYENTNIIAGGYTEWEEISEEDYNFLKKNMYKLNSLFKEDFIVIYPDDISAANRIIDLKKELDKIRIRDEKLIKEQEERARLRIQNQTETQRKKKLKQLEKLKKEFGEI